MFKRILKRLWIWFLYLIPISLMSVLHPIDKYKNTINDQDYIIFSIDCGRKYFTPKQLKTLMKESRDQGYSDINFMVGNDGLRFLLDDMDINLEKSNLSFKSEDVKRCVIESNEEYHHEENGNYLTEAEMNDIIDYGKEIGLGIIPLINTPGHMDSIVSTMDKLGIEDAKFLGSKSSFNVENPVAKEFVLTINKLYIDYFSSKGCKLYNFGADEMGFNPKTLKGGFGWLIENNKFSYLVDYVNELSAYIKEKDMIPICFNDAIYYKNCDTQGTFDTDIVVCYYTPGWPGYYVASVDFLLRKGHKIINCNNKWYWVNGRHSLVDYANWKVAWKGVTLAPYNQIHGGDYVPIIGAMLCVWCDSLDAEIEMDNIIKLLTYFSSKNKEHMYYPPKIRKEQ